LRRALIISAGVLMNIILTVVLLSLGYLIGMPQAISPEIREKAVVRDEKIQVVEVLEGYAASGAKIEIGDVILSIDGNNFSNIEDIQKYIGNTSAGAPLKINIDRGGEILEKEVTTTVLSETGEPGIGIGMIESGTVYYPWYLAILNGIKMTYHLAIAIIIAFYELMKGFIMGKGVTMDVAGPVGIAAYTGKIAKMGFNYIIQFAALLSLNLAIINFIPFPALDGGRFFFIIIEKIFGRPVNHRLENALHNLGFSLLIILVIIVTFHDIFRFTGGPGEWWHKIIK